MRWCEDSGLGGAAVYIGVAGLGLAALCAIAVMFVQQWLVALMLLSLIYGGHHVSAAHDVCRVPGYRRRVRGGRGRRNEHGGPDRLVRRALLFGYLVDRYGNYNLPFMPMAALLVTGCYLWLKVDPSERLIPATYPAASPGELATDLA